MVKRMFHFGLIDVINYYFILCYAIRKKNESLSISIKCADIANQNAKRNIILNRETKTRLKYAMF